VITSRELGVPRLVVSTFHMPPVSTKLHLVKHAQTSWDGQVHHCCRRFIAQDCVLSDDSAEARRTRDIVNYAGHPVDATDCPAQPLALLGTPTEG